MAYFKAHLGLEVEKVRRYAEPLTLLAFDVLAGDEEAADSPAIEEVVLKVIADYVREATRTVDLFARCGGNRFILMLSRTPLAGAELIVERLQARVVTLPGYSLRTAVVPYDDGDDPEAVLERVAAALGEPAAGA
ncbi:MAG: diguanylate cyclase [Gammaproteobacteria bacterium]|nr:diguanylate cyclase [Gammaproteobacteria bacterium]